METKIIDKIKKLLALTKSTNEAEAQSALAHAQRLMIKHNVNFTDIKEEEDVVIESYIYETTQGISIRRKQLAATMVKHYQVKIFIRNSRLVVMGRPDDASIFIESYEYAWRVFQQLSKKYLAERGTQSRSESLRVQNVYFLGFCDGLVEALKNNESQYALVPVVPNAVVKAYNKLTMRSSRSAGMVTGRMSESDYQRGVRDGRSSQSKKSLV